MCRLRFEAANRVCEYVHITLSHLYRMYIHDILVLLINEIKRGIHVRRQYCP